MYRDVPTSILPASYGCFLRSERTSKRWTDAFVAPNSLTRESRAQTSRRVDTRRGSLSFHLTHSVSLTLPKRAASNARMLDLLVYPSSRNLGKSPTLARCTAAATLNDVGVGCVAKQLLNNDRNRVEIERGVWNVNVGKITIARLATSQLKLNGRRRAGSLYHRRRRCGEKWWGETPRVGIARHEFLIRR